MKRIRTKDFEFVEGSTCLAHRVEKPTSFQSRSFLPLPGLPGEFFLVFRISTAGFRFTD